VARFREHGFEATNVADIARDAGVTERTFYRHFPSKEAVLFQDYEHRLEWFAAALAQRPPNEPICDSVLVAVESFPDDPEIVRQAALLRSSLISRELAEEHLQRIQGVFAEEIRRHAARRLTDRPGAGLEAAVIGSAVSAALLEALKHWAERGAVEDLGDLVHRAVALVRDGIPAGAAAVRGGQGRSLRRS
jgi:AcrR family transcriptional regulator